MRWRWTAAVTLVMAVLVSAAAFGQVIINEIAWAGTAAGSSDEWIELRNATDRAVDLAGWTLQVGDAVIHLGEAGDSTLEVRRSIVDPGGYILLERTDDATVSDVEADVIYKGGLSNTGEDLILRNALGETVDSALFAEAGWPAGAASDGEPAYATMERLETPSGDPAWQTCLPSFAACGLDAEGNALAGTPRSENSTESYLAQAPQVNLIAPAAGEVRGTILVQWSAVDPDGDDARLRIAITLWEGEESVVLGENLANSGSFAWDTTAHSDGPYGLMVTAEDPHGNWNIGSLREIEVKNQS
jgi:hypothetical protein